MSLMAGGVVAGEISRKEVKSLIRKSSVELEKRPRSNGRQFYYAESKLIPSDKKEFCRTARGTVFKIVCADKEVL